MESIPIAISSLTVGRFYTWLRVEHYFKDDYAQLSCKNGPSTDPLLHVWPSRSHNRNPLSFKKSIVVLSSSITSHRGESSRLITAQEIDPKQISPNSYSGGDNASSTGKIGGDSKRWDRNIRAAKNNQD
ncbi:hypothetical protein CDAR_98931 [Caerostris darwini]|uniref:Ycf15 n=1 Tax=Caerostris darwini TaxID=1538125 RepID=A0AAV4Q1B8_9ARAC|nr:hypothetical protein CDAR_98931 [Caerostris darwini]